MSNDIIKLLLGAEIDPNAAKSIQTQIENISKNAKAIKINVEVDGGAIKAIENINKTIAKMSQSSMSSINTSQVEAGLQRVTNHFKKGEESASRMTRVTVAGFEKTVELIDKINSKSIKKDVTYDFAKEQKQLLQEANRIAKLGEKQGNIAGINFKDNDAIKQYALSMQDAGAEITRFNRGLNSAGQEQIAMTVRTQQTNNMVKEQRLVVDQNTQALYKQGEALKPNVNRMLGWAESMKVAITKSIQWGNQQLQITHQLYVLEKR